MKFKKMNKKGEESDALSHSSLLILGIVGAVLIFTVLVFVVSRASGTMLDSACRFNVELAENMGGQISGVVSDSVLMGTGGTVGGVVTTAIVSELLFFCNMESIDIGDAYNKVDCNDFIDFGEDTGFSLSKCPSNDADECQYKTNCKSNKNSLEWKKRSAAKTYFHLIERCFYKSSQTPYTNINCFYMGDSSQFDANTFEMVPYTRSYYNRDLTIAEHLYSADIVVQNWPPIYIGWFSSDNSLFKGFSASFSDDDSISGPLTINMDKSDMLKSNGYVYVGDPIKSNNFELPSIDSFKFPLGPVEYD